MPSGRKYIPCDARDDSCQHEPVRNSPASDVDYGRCYCQHSQQNLTRDLEERLTWHSTWKYTDRPCYADGVKVRVRNDTRNTVLASAADVAGTSAERRTGLLGRQRLDPGAGLWIRPCESVHTFFMKFAIDLVYLDGRQQVRKVRNSMAPWRLSACLTAHSVLELPAGSVGLTGTRPGDQLAIEFLTDPTPGDPSSR
jgi:uncharacterized protein